jgi:hypothetical protein
LRALDPITRADFQALSELRLREAAHLLAGGYAEGAYYLAGYAVECALKACICRQVEQYQFPSRPETVREMNSHRLVDLLRLAGLRASLEEASAADVLLGARWLIVKDWSEESRYALPLQTDAEQLYTAAADPTHGVLQWLRQHW